MVESCLFPMYDSSHPETLHPMLDNPQTTVLLGYRNHFTFPTLLLILTPIIAIFIRHQGVYVLSSSHFLNKSRHSLFGTVQDLATLVNSRAGSGDDALHLDNYPLGFCVRMKVWKRRKWALVHTHCIIVIAFRDWREGWMVHRDQFILHSIWSDQFSGR